MNVKVCEADGLLRYLKPVLLALFATFVASGKDVVAQIAGNVEGGVELRVCKVHASLSAAVEDVRANIIARFLSPEGLLRDYEGELPTPADCRDGRPNAIGWKTPIENGPMFTGLYLDSICIRADKTGALADRALARKLAAGLMRSASVSEVKGMVVRGFGTDGVCHYPLGSEDQTLPWFFGLFAYWRSGIPSDAEKSAVVAKMREVADALVANDWGCPCDGAFKGQVRGAFMENELPFRGAAHSLFVLRAMWEVTGDNAWLRLYENALGRRQKSTSLTMLDVCREGWATDVEKFPLADGHGMWIYVCAQGCLARLAEMDPARAEYFKSGIARNAARARSEMSNAAGFSNKIERPFKYANWRTGYSWRPQKTQRDAEEVAATGNTEILGHRRRFESRTMKRPLSAAAVCAFANVAREDVEKTICAYDYSQLNFCEFFLAEVAAVQLMKNAESFGTAGLPDGWSSKFYHGLEAVGSVTWVPGAFKGKGGAMRCAWESGAFKFGVEKEVKTDLSGWVDWIVEADVKSEGDYGYAGAAMSFLDGHGRDAGSVSNLRPIVAKEWRKAKWTFSAPKEARRFFVQILSLDKEPVMFANVRIESRQGLDRGEIPFEVMALPAEKNVWWNGGKVKTLNFSDAPLPTLFYMKGAKAGRDALRFVIDIPAELEIKDAYCPNGTFYETFRPLEAKSFRTNGIDCVRYVFGHAKFFTGRSYGALNPARYFIDEGTSIALVIAPRADGTVCERIMPTYPIRYRMMLGEKRGQEKMLEMEFRPLPKGLKTSKDFFVFSWNNADRHFSSDSALLAAARAYEAAGIRSFRRTPHGGLQFTRKNEIASLLEKRPCRYIFALGLGNLWMPSRLGIKKGMAEELGVRMSVSSDPRYAGFARVMCPEYFTKSESLQKRVRDNVRKVLSSHGAKDGDWVTFDMEPWHSSTYCHCDVCHKAFAEFAGLSHVPDAAETQSMALRDKWALFRCAHNAKSVEMLVKYIHEYNPTLKCIDYDYVMPYGDEKGMMARRRSVGKDTLANEQWLDGHLCSYYHKIDKAAFDAIRNDTRHLKKLYVPMGANDGAGGYLQPNEVLSPKQVRQFALAAFVHGCPGIGFYSGNAYEGEMLLALMEAQNEIVKWEWLPWGKADGSVVAKSESGQFAFASTVKPDGGEVLALFNYDSEETISVDVVGTSVELKPYETRFVDLGNVGSKPEGDPAKAL